jgi:hypothetical protein
MALEVLAQPSCSDAVVAIAPKQRPRREQRVGGEVGEGDAAVGAKQRDDGGHGVR